MTAEQQARDMLERIGVEDAQRFTAGDLVELANMIAERDEQCRLLGMGGEREARLMAAVEELQRVVAQQSALRHEALAREAQLRHEVGLCYRMLLSEPDTKGALFKAENLLREALALPQDDSALREMIKAAKAEEREACAKACEELYQGWNAPEDAGVEWCAEAIRERKG